MRSCRAPTLRLTSVSYSSPTPTRINIQLRKMASFHDIHALDKSKKDIHLGTLAKDKVVLAVNVASQCGYTPQYKGLQKLHEELGPKGLVILGFPCNQFGAQEPGTNEEIQSFCQKNYGVSFPVLDKIEVNGANTSPVYKFLKESAKVDKISWNFEKFLVDKNGKVVSHYKSSKTPEQLKPEIEKLL